MSGTLYDLYMPRAFAGMKGDSMDDNVDSIACGPEQIPFGRICTYLPGRRSIQAGGPPGAAAQRTAGISLHDHIVGAYGNGYRQYDAVSLLTRGRVWVELAPTATNIDLGESVNYDPLTGYGVADNFLDAVEVPNAVYRSLPISIIPVWPSTTLGAARIALVELHYPFSPGP